MSVEHEWKLFQDQISRIEHALAPRGAQVKSPDRIHRREVDATVRYKVGSAEILITIECRRRKHTQDVTWIEQLATKQENVGAAKTIAVSFSGFSEPAKELAVRKNIDLRSLDELDAGDVEKYLKFSGVVHSACHSHLVDCHWRLQPESPDDEGVQPEIPHALSEELQADYVNARAFRQKNGSVTSLQNLWSHIQNMYPVHKDVPTDGSKVRRRFQMDLSAGLLSIETTRGQRSIVHLVLDFDLWIEQSENPTTETTAFSYTDIVSGESLRGADQEVTIFGQTCRLTSVADRDKLHVLIKPADPR